MEPDPSIDAATSPFDRRVWRVVGDPLVRGARTAVTALPLAGIAVAVKDLIAVAGQPVGAGNPAWLAEQQPQLRSAPALEALLAAGADVVGIARTDEFAYSLAGTNVHYGTPPNPAAPGAISGGSTSGPASAVALGQAAVGLGTDTGGSIRIPASYQGLVGIRTSHGAIDTAGVLPLAPAFDTVGWLTRDTPTALRVAGVLLDGTEDRALDAARTVVLPAAQRCASPDVSLACDVLRDRLAAGGVLPPVQDDDVPADVLQRWLAAFRTVQAYQAWTAHGAWVRTHPGALGDDIAERFAVAAQVTEAEAERAAGVAEQARAQLQRLLANAVLVLPSSAGGALPLHAAATEVEAERAGTLQLTCVAGLAGAPAVSVPVLQTSDGRPAGFCLVGAPGTDRDLLRLAHRIALWSETFSP